MNISSRIGTAPLTLDLLLRQNAQRSGDTLALIDAPDRPLWADGAPRRMTWNQVDASVSAVAGRFFEMGLPNEAVVIVQGLNVTDTLIALLGSIRAGLVAAIVPFDYTPVEIVTLAERLNAKAVLSSRRMGPEQPLRLLRHLVDESIADIRFIGAFGSDLPSGTISFEDCIGYPKTSAITRLSRRERPEECLAIMTLDRGVDGGLVVARNHREWCAAACLVVDEMDITRQSRLLSPMAPSSLAGLASGLAAWLLAGCQLVLHQAFDATVFAVQMNMHAVTHVVMPDTALQAAIAEGLFSGRAPEAIASLAREPHRSLILPEPPCPIRLFAALGEIGLVPMTAESDGHFRLPMAMAGGVDEQPFLETLVEDGQLSLRGEHVSLIGFDMSDGEQPYPISPEDWVATAYPAAAKDSGVRILGARNAQAAGGLSRTGSGTGPEILRTDAKSDLPVLAGAA